MYVVGEDVKMKSSKSKVKRGVFLLETKIMAIAEK